VNAPAALSARRSGHIINVSSHAGDGGWPRFGIYCARKFALEGLSESLAQELAPLGVHVTIVEPGPFRTEWVGPSLVRSNRQIAVYAESSGQVREFTDTFCGTQPGDPQAAARAIADVAALAQPPRRLPLGAAAVREWRLKLASAEQELNQWRQSHSRPTSRREASCRLRTRRASSGSDYVAATWLPESKRREAGHERRHRTEAG